MQRLKRAVDCSLKKSYLSKDIQDMQTPYSWYLKVMQSGQAIIPQSSRLQARLYCDLAFLALITSRQHVFTLCLCAHYPAKHSTLLTQQLQPASSSDPSSGSIAAHAAGHMG